MATNDMVGGGGDIQANEVAIDYLKASDFRVIWADGGVGNVTPNGLVHVAFYAERHAIPRRQVFKLQPVAGTEFGNIGNEVLEKRQSRASIVREMACDVMMSPDTAETLAKWLLEQAAIARQSLE